MDYPNTVGLPHTVSHFISQFTIVCVKILNFPYLIRCLGLDKDCRIKGVIPGGKFLESSGKD